MEHGHKLKDALDSLRSRGFIEKADALQTKLTQKFKGVLTEKELLEYPLENLTAAVDLSNLFLKDAKPQGSALDKHISGLKREGWTVVMGAKYADQ